MGCRGFEILSRLIRAYDLICRDTERPALATRRTSGAIRLPLLALRPSRTPPSDRRDIGRPYRHSGTSSTTPPPTPYSAYLASKSMPSPNVVLVVVCSKTCTLRRRCSHALTRVRSSVRAASRRRAYRRPRIGLCPIPSARRPEPLLSVKPPAPATKKSSRLASIERKVDECISPGLIRLTAPPHRRARARHQRVLAPEGHRRRRAHRR